MNTIAYIESPYQLLNALEYLSLSDRKKIKFIIRNNGSEKQQLQLEEVLKKINEAKVIHFFLPQTGLLKGFRVINLLLTLLFFSIFYDEIIIGDARSIIAKLILPIFNITNKSIVLVDDGLYLLSYVKNIVSYKYTIFTNLPLESNIEETGAVKLRFLKKKFNKKAAVGENNLNFIGMKLSEVKLMDEDVYIDVLCKVVSGYPSATVNYYAHRGENESKLKKLIDKGFIVHRNSLPIEEYFLTYGAPKGAFYTFYSTALYNLSNMLEGCVFYAIEPEISYWPMRSRENIGLCYELFRGSNINTCSISL